MIEKHVASIYTISVFYDAQAEIFEGCFSCKITWRGADEDITVYTIKEGQTKSFQDDDAEMIPPKYIVQRWTKNGNAKEIDAHTEDKDESKILGKEILNFMQEKKGGMMKRQGMMEAKRKNSDLVDMFYRTGTTTTITIKPPPISKNKGSGKRLKSAHEKASDMKKNDGRKCNGCGQKPARHDFRNCLMNPKNQQKANKNDKA
nr:protein FAR1-RELATED SEQUENCE 5-like [Ipomoea batatas]